MFEDKLITKNIFFVNKIDSIQNICLPYINSVKQEKT